MSRSWRRWVIWSNCEVPGIVAGEEAAAPDPGQGDDLEGAGAGLDEGGLDTVRDVDALHGQGGKYLEGGGSTGDGGKVVVAGDEEDGDALRGELGDALGEFALVGLGRVAVLVGVAGKEDGVDAVVDGVPD